MLKSPAAAEGLRDHEEIIFQMISSAPARSPRTREQRVHFQGRERRAFAGVCKRRFCNEIYVSLRRGEERVGRPVGCSGSGLGAATPLRGNFGRGRGKAHLLFVG